MRAIELLVLDHRDAGNVRLSDSNLAFTATLCLPTFEAGGMGLLRRLIPKELTIDPFHGPIVSSLGITLIVKDGVIEHVFYPVFPTDRNAGDVCAWLAANR